MVETGGLSNFALANKQATKNAKDNKKDIQSDRNGMRRMRSKNKYRIE